MRTIHSILRSEPTRHPARPLCSGFFLVLTVLCCGIWAHAQDDPLNKVHVPPPSSTPPGTPAAGAPAGAETPVVSGTAATRARPGAMIRMNVDMVLVPITVTDPMNRLVTGLEKEDFQVYENNGQQAIRTFASEDAPVSIGIIFDLSGSMTSKLLRARESILQFVKTANPEDEFFVIGFNDRPELIEDFTSSVEDIVGTYNTPIYEERRQCNRYLELVFPLRTILDHRKQIQRGLSESTTIIFPSNPNPRPPHSGK